MENYEKKADENLVALKRKNENHLKKNVIISILFSAALLTGIMVCLICDTAISGRLTWSLIPVCSIVLAWVICFPAIMLGKRGIMVSLISLSIFMIPYLYLLSALLKVKEVFSVGSVTAAASLVFLWITAGIFYRMGKTRKLAALGILFLLAIPFTLVINGILWKTAAEPFFDMWDILSVFILLILAFTSFICDYAVVHS